MNKQRDIDVEASIKTEQVVLHLDSILLFSTYTNINIGKDFLALCFRRGKIFVPVFKILGT